MSAEIVTLYSIDELTGLPFCRRAREYEAAVVDENNQGVRYLKANTKDELLSQIHEFFDSVNDAPGYFVVSMNNLTNPFIEELYNAE